MFNNTEFKIPQEIWFYILDKFIDEGLSPHDIPLDYSIKAKYDYMYGKSLCGIPYGVWTLYTKCSYYYAPSYGECNHPLDSCRSTTMHIPVIHMLTNFNADPDFNPSMKKRYLNITPMKLSLPFILYQTSSRFKIGQIDINNFEKHPVHVRRILIYNKIYNHKDYRIKLTRN